MTLWRRWRAVVVFAVFSLQISQGQQAAPPPIYLKSRVIDPSAPASFASLSLQQATLADRQRVLVQFQGGIEPELLMRLRNRGVRVLSYVPQNSLIVSAPHTETFDGLGVTYRAALEAWDKIPEKFLADTNGWRTPVPMVFEFYEDVNSEDARSALLQAGATLRQHPDLRPWQILADASPQLAYQVASDSRLAYVFPASKALLNGAPATACQSGFTSTAGIAAALAAGQGDGWDGPGKGSANLTYSLGAMTDRLDSTLARTEIERAIAEWVNYVKINIRRGSDRSAEKNLDILFATGAHGDPYPFDGRSGSLAHTFYPSPPNSEPRAGDLHLDGDELWGGGTDLYSVVLHELGHAFGLGHSTDPESVMYPYYRRADALTQDDITSIQLLYASGPGSLDTSLPGSGGSSSGPFTVTVQPPSSTSVTTETITLQGTVTGGQGKVVVNWFVISGTAIGAAQVNGTSWTAAGIPLAIGTNQILIGATDDANAQSSMLVTIERTGSSGNPPGNTPVQPTVTVTEPATFPATVATATVRIRGTASHSSGIAAVRWRNPVTGRSGTATGTTSWDTGLLDLGTGLNTITIEVQATDTTLATRDLAITRSGGQTQQPTEPTNPTTPEPPTDPPVDPPTDPTTPTNPTPGNDTTAPTLRITTPSTTTVTTTAATITVSGTASDNSGVTSVTWTNGTATGTASGTTTWTTSVPLLIGMNNIIIRAADAAGNSSWRTVNVTRRAN
ncbi:hypothetical protein F183_A20120 [Bryobacterales bacterium F-183]|nr:hypothetical protein F183_A20120 [Bryobacterales bacterium F-183]